RAALGLQRAQRRDPGRDRGHARNLEPVKPLREEQVGGDDRDRRELGAEHGAHRDPVSGAHGVGGEPDDLAESARDDEREGATPTTTTASIAPEPAPRCSPAATAITAAIAPSVDVIGATIPTLPTRSAAYESRSPPTLPAPDSASQVQAVPSRPSGRPCATA